MGEVVVTVLQADYPLLRFGTGDLSADAGRALPHRPHQHTASRAGWAAPTRPKVRGMFVHPSQVAEVVKATPIARARLVVEGEMANDRMTFIERPYRPRSLAEAVAGHGARRRPSCAATSCCAAPGSLPTTAR